MRTALLIGALGVLAAAAVHEARSSTARTVPCSEIIGQARTGTDGGYRVVLGVVSVPPAYAPQAATHQGGPWPYWRKAGLVIRANDAPVTVSVPRFWRKRAAITWGNGTKIVSSLRIAACPRPEGAWNAYAGGFFTRARSACVPLVFTIGRRSTTVRFGLGRRCPAVR